MDKRDTMAKKRLTLLVPFETHRKLKILASATGQSMTKILMDCIDEKYVELEKGNQALSSEKKPGFFYYR